jgi:GDPmannose 4,6-dehydratase
MTAILFGANGQDGHYLSELLLGCGIQVIPVSRKGDVIKADVADYEVVSSLIEQYKPDLVFHLAANSTTRHEALFENHATISTGTLNILEAVRTIWPQAKVFISGSGLQFKNEGRPIKETDPFEARDAYSVSRIHSVYAARYYRTLGLKVYIGYFFNHESPRRTERHISKKIAEAVKRIEQGSTEKLEIGDISVIKEWTFAGDIVNGIWTLVQQDAIYEANISSGAGYSIMDWLDACFGLVGKNWQDHTVTKDNFVPEYKQLVSDPSLVFSLGWKPAVSLNQLAEMMLAKT